MRTVTALLALVLSTAIFVGHTLADSSVQSQAKHTPKEYVILAHGLGRGDSSMWRMRQRFEDQGFGVCTLDYDTIGETVESVLQDTAQQMDLCLKNTSADSIHFVGHSLGGLVIRAYLQAHPELVKDPRFGKAVLIGTPNKGSEIADHYDDSWLMEIGGGISEALTTGQKSLGQQLEQSHLQIGIIAGTKSSAMTNKLFNGPNDGLVSVESTKLDNMQDFIAIKVGHAGMRYNEQVARQTLYFLRHGEFDHPATAPNL